MPVKVIAYLLIAVFSIIIAVALLAKLWNTFLGQDVVQNDVKSLAATIEKMLNDDRPYIQEPFLLQIEDKLVLGFEANDQSLWPLHLPAEIPKPATCNNQPCICLAAEENIEKCFRIDARTNNYVVLAADFTGYWTPQNTPMARASQQLQGATGAKIGFTPQQAADITAEIKRYEQALSKFSKPIGSISSHPEINNDNYTILWVDKTQFAVRQTGQGTTAKAIVPLLLEKITRQGNTFIIVHPDTDRARARPFYLDECGPQSSDSCSGLTEVDSFARFAPKYCAHNVSSALFNTGLSACAQQTALACTQNAPIFEPCVCGSQLALYGFCINGVRYDVQCDIAADQFTCADYCRQDADATTCSQAEAQLCQTDVCDTKSDCRSAYKYDSGQYSWQCTDEASLPIVAVGATVTSTIQALLSDPNPYASKELTLPIGKNAIVGFDVTDSTVAGIQRPPLCDTTPCICSVQNEPVKLIQSCATLPVPAGANFMLGVDATGVTFERTKGSIASDPLIVPGLSLGPFILNTDTVDIEIERDQSNQYSSAKRGVSGSDDKATLTVLLEKYTSGSQTYIIAIPKGQRSESRWFYLRQCGAASGAAADCSGKVPYQTVNNGAYCGLSSGGVCYPNSLNTCSDASAVTSPCMCGSALLTSGWCIKNAPANLDCRQTASCENTQITPFIEALNRG